MRLVRSAKHHVGRFRWRLLDTAAGSMRHTEGGTVALTFDDGPHPESTGQVLDVLAALDVPATFFCVGRNAERYPALVRRAREEGHAVGSHSFSHPDPEVTPLAALGRDYSRGRAAVEDVLGEPAPLFRPPRGYVDVLRATQLRLGGTRPWLWSVDPEDWHPDAERHAIEEAAGLSVGGDVVLLHDWVEQPWAPRALDRSQTIEALPEVVGAIRARGLRLVALAGER